MPAPPPSPAGEQHPSFIALERALSWRTPWVFSMGAPFLKPNTLRVFPVVNPMGVLHDIESLRKGALVFSSVEKGALGISA